MSNYIRFTLLSTDPDSGKRQGILTAAHELRDSDVLTRDEHRQLRMLLGWFNEKLKVPKVLGTSETRRALSWFKPEAQKPIARMWELKRALDYHGYNVEVTKTKEPGRIIYEDGWQIVAIPPKGRK